MSKKMVAGIVTASPFALVAGAAALVQGVIAFRTDRVANAATDAWMQQDFRNWATEILDSRTQTA